MNRSLVVLALSFLCIGCATTSLPKNSKYFTVTSTQPSMLQAEVAFACKSGFVTKGIGAMEGITTVHISLTNKGTEPLFVSWRDSFYTIADESVGLYTGYFLQGTGQLDLEHDERDTEVAPGETLFKTCYAKSQFVFVSNDSMGWRSRPIPENEVSLTLSLRSGEVQEDCLVTFSKTAPVKEKKPEGKRKVGGLIGEWMDE